MNKQKNIEPKILFKIGDTIRWEGTYFKEFKEGWDFEKAVEYSNNGGNIRDVAISHYQSGENKIVDIVNDFDIWWYLLDNGKQISTTSKTTSLVK